MKMILIFTQSNIWLIRWIWKFKPPVWDGRKADMHITAQASLHLNKDGMNNLGLINDYFFD